MTKTPEGTIRIWSGTKYIKSTGHPIATQRGWVQYHRYIYHFFETEPQTTCAHCNHDIHWYTPRKANSVTIRFKDLNKQNTDLDNLEATCIWCSSFISTSPYTQPEHQQALKTHGHVPPDQRLSKTRILINEWGIPINDVLHILEQHRQQLQPATHVN